MSSGGVACLSDQLHSAIRSVEENEGFPQLQCHNRTIARHDRGCWAYRCDIHAAGKTCTNKKGARWAMSLATTHLAKNETRALLYLSRNPSSGALTHSLTHYRTWGGMHPQGVTSISAVTVNLPSVGHKDADKVTCAGYPNLSICVNACMRACATYRHVMS